MWKAGCIDEFTGADICCIYMKFIKKTAKMYGKSQEIAFAGSPECDSLRPTVIIDAVGAI
jgi:hypothetical protein